MSKLQPVDHDPFAGVTLKPVENNPFELKPVEGNPFQETGLGDRILNSFKKAGEDLKSGYEGSASSFYNTGANILSLINKASDYLTQETGVGTMSKETALGHVEQWLRNASKEMADRKSVV